MIMNIKILRQIVHLKHFLLNQGVQNGVCTALLCFLTVGGFMLSTGDGLQSLSSVPARYYGQSSYTGATGYSVASGSGVPVVSHSTLGHSVSGAAGAVSSGASGLSASSGSSVSIGMIGHTTHISNVAFGGGGGMYSGGGGTGATATTGTSKSTGTPSFSVGVIAVAMPVRGGLAEAPQGSKTVMGMGTTPNSGGLKEYEGDDPGVITGAENGVVDNPIITSYGQPIGDVLWPLLLMALMYVLWILVGRKVGAGRIRVLYT